ncbi:ABC transporter substrate-binding protein [Variovorax sp. PCZ-1]|uniref:ABC transporter substrate-binding protein n=1 Tax=Variovorax sp. PCZ-1 TaxID=2835533 RepID=UPI001BCE2308|nr:ABC transporter substrate-binding protein [Variovorax sp. PCZ-1]MBS7806687.1 ABC transporter substrate-binding protein [Variovorax sp. PCZ-1]
MNLQRRQLVGVGLASSASLAAPSIWAQGIASRSPMVGQIADVSNAYQDISKDFIIGSRAAWQEINAAGGIRGQRIRHQVIEMDGSVAQRDASWQQLRDDENCVATFGTCADPLAVQITTKNSNERTELVHSAPWLQNSAVDIERGTFPIFSTREHQIQHALQNMSNVGITSLSVVYQSERDFMSNTLDIQRIAKNLKLTLKQLPVQADLLQQARQISATQVPLVLFVGGTPELVQFMQGWNRSGGIRYIVALADVNLQTALQMSGGKHVPVIGTQAVPVVTSSARIAQRFRQVLAKYFDEPPTALSLAGYISARYTAQVMQSAKSLNRSAVFEAFSRRQTMEVDGFRVELENGRLQSAFVTQSMMRMDGRVIG